MKRFAALFLLALLNPVVAQNVGISNAYSNAPIGQLPGTSTNDNASTGNIGEYVSSTVASGSAINLSSGTTANITSISLTPGDWDVRVLGSFFPANTTAYTSWAVSVTTTSATNDLTPGRYSNVTVPSITSSGLTTEQVSIPPTRFSLSATTTIYMVATAGFSVSTMTGYGVISARRVR